MPVSQWPWNCARSMTEIVLCYVQKFWMIDQLRTKLWANDITPDLGASWVSDLLSYIATDAVTVSHDPPWWYP